MERGDEKHVVTDGKRNKCSRRNTSRAEEKEKTDNKRKQDLVTELSSVLYIYLFRFLPEVAFVSGILDVVADVVVHSMSCGAVSSIKNLESKHTNKKSGLCTGVF